MKDLGLDLIKQMFVDTYYVPKGPCLQGVHTRYRYKYIQS